MFRMLLESLLCSAAAKAGERLIEWVLDGEPLVDIEIT